MKSEFFIKSVLFSLIFILTLSLVTYGQPPEAEAQFQFRIVNGQLADSTNILGDSIYYKFEARYKNVTGTWSIIVFHSGGQTKMDSTKGTLIASGLTTGEDIPFPQPFAELDTSTSAMLLTEDEDYFLYATHSGITPTDSVIGVSSGIFIRHQPYADSTRITPSSVTGDTTLDSGSYESPQPVSYGIKFFPQDLDDDSIEVRIFLNLSDTLTNRNLTFKDTSPWDSIDALDNSTLIATETINDTVFNFDITEYFPVVIPKGTYYVYVALNDNKHANVYHSNNNIIIKHSPKITLDRPAVPNPTLFLVDTIDSAVQQEVTISWAGAGFDGDIDMDDDATIAIFLDTAASYHGDLSMGGVADSFYASGTTSIMLTDGFSISENGDWENDMYVLDLTTLSQSIINRTSNSYWRFYVLMKDGEDTTVSASPGSVYFKHTPYFKFLQDFGGEEELPRNSLASGSLLGSNQVKIKKSDVFRINFEAFDLDSVAEDTGQYIRIVASRFDTFSYYKDFVFGEAGAITDGLLINSSDGSNRQDNVDSTLTTVDTYYDWYTGNMDSLIYDGDYYIYAFISLTESPDTFTFNYDPNVGIDSTVMFLAGGSVKITGTSNAAVTPNVRIIPNIVSLTKDDTITLDIKINTNGDNVQGVFINFDLPDTLFEILDQSAPLGGIQPYIFPNDTDAFFGTDTLTGGGSTVYNSGSEQWEFSLQKYSIAGGSTSQDSTVAQFQVVSKGTEAVGSEETKIYFIMEEGRKTRFTDGFDDLVILLYSPALTTRTAPMARITGNVPLEGRASSFSKEITFELREIGSLVPINNPAFDTLNDQNPNKSGIQITTDRDGKYELSGVPEGKYNLVALTPNYLSGQYSNLNIVAGDYLVGINPTRDSLNVDPDINEHDFQELRGGDATSDDSTGYGDNWVDAADVDFIELYYTLDTSATGYGEMGDVNGNGEIDLADLLIATSNINQAGVPPTFTKVPGKDNSDVKLKLIDIPEIVFKGDEFDVDVWIENVSDIRGYQFTVNYDNTKYELINLERDMTEGDFLVSGNPYSNKTVFFTIDDRKGKMHVGCLLGRVKTAEGSGNLVSLRFKSKVDGETPDIGLKNILVGNSENKLTKLGNVVNLPDEFELSQNYPNPFNPETNIRFQLPDASKVTLKIYNILGQEIKTLVNRNLVVGYHSVKWDGTNNFGINVASGVYIYQIKAGNFVASKKMVFLK